jgi:peptidoglycan/xylan/chitin deacetylase (PgdA/CDA1 family)
MSLLKAGARKVLHNLGGLGVVRARHAHQLRILMYHHFPADQAGLRRQCQHIRRHYAPVALADVADALQTGKSLPANALAITIDDGYRDFLLNGFPAFHDFGIPATVFLVSDFLDRRCWLWWKEIQFALAHSEVKSVTTGLGNGSRSYELNSPDERAEVAGTIVEALKRLPNEERIRQKNAIIEQLGVMLPSEIPASWEPLSWNEVRELTGNGIEFGAHTRTHPILSSIGDPTQLEAEITGSKSRLEEELVRPVLHFSYPNGRTEDVGSSVVDCTRKAGFRTAVTTEPGMNDLSQTDPFLLQRIAVTPEYPEYYFAELLAGVRSS